VDLLGLVAKTLQKRVCDFYPTPSQLCYNIAFKGFLYTPVSCQRMPNQNTNSNLALTSGRKPPGGFDLRGKVSTKKTGPCVWFC